MTQYEALILYDGYEFNISVLASKDYSRMEFKSTRVLHNLIYLGSYLCIGLEGTQGVAEYQIVRRCFDTSIRMGRFLNGCRRNLVTFVSFPYVRKIELLLHGMWFPGKDMQFMCLHFPIGFKNLIFFRNVMPASYVTFFISLPLVVEWSTIVVRVSNKNVRVLLNGNPNYLH